MQKIGMVSPSSTRRRDWSMIALVFFATRLLMLLVAAGAAGNNPVFSTFNNWDAALFAGIAQHGYSASDPSKMAFFPGMPLVMHLFGLVGIPTAVTGAVVSQVATLIAAFAMERLGGRWAAVAWLLAPMAVFTTVGYSEAVFCAFGFWAWVMARRGRWWLAAILAAGACMMRISGLFLTGGLGLLALFGGEPTVVDAEPSIKVAQWSQRLKNLAWLFIPLVVIAGYQLYLYRLTGQWDAWLNAQRSGWSRSWTTPWQGFQNTLFAIYPSAWPSDPTRAWMFRFEIASVAIGYLTVVGCLIRRVWAQAGYVLVQVVALSAVTWFISVNRADLLWFPLFIGIGSVIRWKPKNRTIATFRTGILGAIVVADVCLMLWWAGLFYRGHWAS